MPQRSGAPERRATAASRADRTNRCDDVRQVRRPVRAGMLAAGASSSTTCALVPLKPNELTPAMRRPPIGSQGVELRRHADRKSFQRMCGLGVLKCRCGGMLRCCSDEHELDQPGDARRGLEMADVGLHRAEPQRMRRDRGRRRTPRQAR